MLTSKCRKCGAAVECSGGQAGLAHYACSCGRSWDERLFRPLPRRTRPVVRMRTSWGGKGKPWRRFDRGVDVII